MIDLTAALARIEARHARLAAEDRRAFIIARQRRELALENEKA